MTYIWIAFLSVATAVAFVALATSGGRGRSVARDTAPIPDTIKALRAIKDRERDEQEAKAQRIADCGRDGGHAFGAFGRCVGCGTSDPDYGW